MEKRRVNVRAVILRGDKVFAVKHKHDDGSEREYWAIPGGGLDPMEVLQDGVKREVMEELGVEAVVKQLLFIQQFPSTRADFDEELEFFFSVEDSPAYDSVDLATTTHGAEELVRVGFVDPKQVSMKPDFLSQIDLLRYDGQEGPHIANRL